MSHPDDDVDATVRVRRGGAVPEPTEAPDPDDGSTVVVRRESRRREAAAAAAAAELDQTAVSTRRAVVSDAPAPVPAPESAVIPTRERYRVRSQTPPAADRAAAPARTPQEPVDTAADEAVRRRAALRRAVLLGAAVCAGAALAAVALTLLALAG